MNFLIKLQTRNNENVVFIKIIIVVFVIDVIFVENTFVNNQFSIDDVISINKIIANDKNIVYDTIFVNNKKFVVKAILVVDVICVNNILVNNETIVNDFLYVDKTITSILKRKSNLVYLTFEIDFQLIDDLLYHVKKDYLKLYISKNCILDVLKLIHDDKVYVDHHRVYVRLTFVYIRKFFKKLTIYIRHCSNCQLNQTKRY